MIFFYCFSFFSFHFSVSRFTWVPFGIVHGYMGLA